MTALIITSGAIIITCLILGYLIWRHGRELKIESINSQFVKIDGRIKDIETRVDSLNTKVGARKL